MEIVWIKQIRKAVKEEAVHEAYYWNVI